MRKIYRGTNQFRKFEGKQYFFVGFRFKKRLAEKLAKEKRSWGKNARIIPGKLKGKKIYKVYVR